MTDIALFHSVLGVRPGVSEAADRLRHEGHDVVVVDQYVGRVFDDYDEAGEFAQAIGYPTLMGLAASAVERLPDGFIAAGFSNGGGVAEFVATQRPVRGVLMLSGALDLAMIVADAWPAGVPAQIHYTTADPFRNQSGIDAVAAQIRSARASIEIFDYPGAGHLFTDPSHRRSTTLKPLTCCGHAYFRSAQGHRSSTDGPTPAVIEPVPKRIGEFRRSSQRLAFRGQTVDVAWLGRV